MKTTRQPQTSTALLSQKTKNFSFNPDLDRCFILFLIICVCVCSANSFISFISFKYRDVLHFIQSGFLNPHMWIIRKSEQTSKLNRNLFKLVKLWNRFRSNYIHIFLFFLFFLPKAKITSEMNWTSVVRQRKMFRIWNVSLDSWWCWCQICKNVM